MDHYDPRFEERPASHARMPLIVYLDRDRFANAIDAGTLDVYRTSNGYILFPQDVAPQYLERIV